MVVGDRQTELLEVSLVSGSPGRDAGLLYLGHQPRTAAANDSQRDTQPDLSFSGHDALGREMKALRVSRV